MCWASKLYNWGGVGGPGSRGPLDPLVLFHYSISNYISKKPGHVGYFPVCAFKVGIAFFGRRQLVAVLHTVTPASNSHTHTPFGCSVLQIGSGIDHYKFTDRKFQVVSTVKLYLSE